jgi:hypothetical protein
MRIKFMIFVMVIIDIAATVGLWGYIVAKGVASALLFSLAAAWVFAICMMCCLFLHLVFQRNDYSGMSIAR